MQVCRTIWLFNAEETQPCFSKKTAPRLAFLLVMLLVRPAPGQDLDYPVVDTGQQRCYDSRVEIAYPQARQPFFGQDAQYKGNEPSYRDNGDGTISDLVTGLMWQKNPGPKKTYAEAVAGASACRTGGHSDWRLPSIKELYSLILFSGEDADPQAVAAGDLKPFVDTHFFDFAYGDPAENERIIDSQMATSTKYVSTTMGGNETMFGVNFADGRIKGYPIGRTGRRRQPVKTYYVYYVRGNPEYGQNDFHDNGDGTVTDRATGLTWLQIDSGYLKAGPKKDGRMNWQEALRWCEDLDYAGHSDWRLPNAKELQSLVDYTRSPDTTRSAAIDPMFQVTEIRNGLGEVDYPFYWTGTTHKSRRGGDTAVYVAFGRAMGWMSDPSGQKRLLDVHGAGAQRSDPKTGDPSQFSQGRGPQGDVIGINNMVRAVRGGEASPRTTGPALEVRQPMQGHPMQGHPMRGQPMQGRPMRGQAGQGRPMQGQPMQGQAGPEMPGGSSPPPPGFVSRLDRDGDGRVSPEEFDGPPEVFPQLDADHNGYLTEEEAPLRSGHPMRQQSPGGRPPRRF